jgi:hypothetical protein
MNEDLYSKFLQPVSLLFGTPFLSNWSNRFVSIPALVFSMSTLDSKEGHHIPGVANTDKQEQNHCRANDIQCWGWIFREHKCSDDQ